MKRKSLILSIFALMFISILTTNVFADYKSFGGSAGFLYATVSSPNAKNNTDPNAGIKWNYSSYSNHKMWFRIINSDGSARGSVLLTTTSSTTQYFATTATNGYDYTLQAHRENIIDPSTYVSGTWQP
ncbi:MAG TPA: hypothetical protein VFH18_02830 [Erysipelotrichaceae bacterium]|nr:hypothetical protein [Erysipelotrichaceae bacterium]